MSKLFRGMHIPLIIASTLSANSWEHIGPNNSDIYSIHFVDDSTLIIPTLNEYPRQTYFSYDNGDSWDSIDNQLNGETVRFLKKVGDKHYAGIVSGTGSFYESSDNCSTWTDYYKSDVGDSLYSESRTYSIETIDSTIILGGYECISVSRDGGVNWEIDNLKEDLGDIELGAVYSMTRYGDTIYAGTGYGIIASLDTGRTWETRGYNLNGAVGAKISSLCFLDTVLIAGSHVGIKRNEKFGSIDGHYTNWLTTLPSDWVAEAYVVDDSLLCAFADIDGETKTYLSSDTGKTWEDFSFSTKEVSLNRIYSTSTHYYISTSGGVWRLEKEEDNPVNLRNSLRAFVKSPILFQENSIYLSLEKKSTVSASVYNIQGRRLWKEDDKNFDAGKHKMSYTSLSNLASGVYIYTITINNESFSRRISW